MQQTEKGLKVGVGVMILDHSGDMPKVLLGKRNDPQTHGCGEWAFPGGHVDWLYEEDMPELTEQAAIRETLEETGLVIKNLCKVTFTDCHFLEEEKFYLTVYYSGDIDTANGPSKPEIKEPNKMSEWRFFPINELPSPIFGGVQEALVQWDWSREIGWLDAILTGGKEVIAPQIEPIVRLKDHLLSLKLKKSAAGFSLRKKILKVIPRDESSDRQN